MSKPPNSVPAKISSLKVAAVRPRIYGVKDEMVNIFHVIIKRSSEIELGNNGHDHRGKSWRPKKFKT